MDSKEYIMMNEKVIMIDRRIMTTNVRILLYFVCLFSLSCKQLKTKNKHSERSNNSLEEYFIENNWEYPFDINDTLIFEYCNCNHDIIKKNIRLFCYSDSIMGTDVIAIRVSKAKPLTADALSNRLQIECRIDFYKFGKMSSVGTILPLEGHAIVENKFLLSSEFVRLTFENDTIISFVFPGL